MTSTRAGVMLVTAMLAIATFAVVQDRVTAAGARQYAAAARAAIAGGQSTPVIEDVMAPAIRRSLQWGAASAGVVLLLGLGAVRMIRRQ